LHLQKLTVAQDHGQHIVEITAVRLKVEQNQLVSVVGETGVLFDALKGA
jgi:ABC-type dipeptide/oligopeptide/nickel transport system ATPase component